MTHQFQEDVESSIHLDNSISSSKEIEVFSPNKLLNNKKNMNKASIITSNIDLAVINDPRFKTPTNQSFLQTNNVSTQEQQYENRLDQSYNPNVNLKHYSFGKHILTKSSRKNKPLQVSNDNETTFNDSINYIQSLNYLQSLQAKNEKNDNKKLQYKNSDGQRYQQSNDYLPSKQQKHSNNPGKFIEKNKPSKLPTHGSAHLRSPSRTFSGNGLFTNTATSGKKTTVNIWDEELPVNKNYNQQNINRLKKLHYKQENPKHN